MWIQPYNRNSITEGLDHSGFGVECLTYPISSLSATNHPGSTLFDFGSIQCLPSSAFGRDGSPLSQLPHFLAACSAEFSAGYTHPIKITNFNPDHASLIEVSGNAGILEESVWHSEVFFSNWVRVDRTTEWKWRIKPDWPVDLIVPGPVNHCYHRYHFQYFHWMFDILPRVWLLKSRSPHGKRGKWLVGPLNQPFHAPSLALFDIAASECVWPQSQLPSAGLSANCIVQYNEAIRPEFTFKEPLRTRPAYNNGIHHKGWSPIFVEEIRDRAYRRYNIISNSPTDLIYVYRNPAGHRSLRNNDEVLAKMTQLGFKAVDPGMLSFEDQVRVFSNARAVVGVHGAGMTNILWCRPGTTVLELYPEKLDDIGYRFLSNLMGHRHAVLHCEQFDHPRGVAYADISVDINGLHHALHAIEVLR